MSQSSLLHSSKDVEGFYFTVDGQFYLSDKTESTTRSMAKNYLTL